MDGHGSADGYKDIVLFLATAGVVVPLFRRWKISPILGFILAGVALGPFGLARLGEIAPWVAYFTVGNPDDIAQLAELGVVFLLFMIGLELSWERLRLMRRLVFGLGAAQVGLSLAALTGLAMLLGMEIAPAAAIGAALALSSTAIVMPVLIEQRRQHSVSGRATFSILLFQDLAVAPILVTLAVLGARGGADLSPGLLLAFAPAVLGMIGLVAFGRLFLRPLLRSVARAKSEELFMAACLLVVIGAGLVSAVMGLSMALGAFIAGLLLAETEFRHEVEVTIEPFKGLLLGLFFLSVGIGLNLSLVAARPLDVLGIATGLLVVKGGLIFLLCRLSRMSSLAAAEIALPLAAGGEFAFVILDQAMGLNVVPRGIGELVIVSATLTMALVPVLAALGRRLARRAPPRTVDEAPEEGGGAAGVLVVGFGRVGQLVGEMLTRHGATWVAAERDPRLVEQARRNRLPCFYGDAARSEFLMRCGLGEARALVVTMDNPEAAETVVAVARRIRPDLVIVARARDARHAKRLYEMGATDAVPETVEASLQLSETVLVEIGVPMGLVIASIHERRDEYRNELNRPEALGGRGRRTRANDRV
ncbi:MAG: cation:proton antiporter [Phenylobacterium sp.]|uniref:cation:proton antiporter domain-containing protein n=1 Tax=Phenylobacterium sp. TaxID=1871053 RepID=UPI00272593D7|nr:cation:proton antiporter [Phenylobacterium sp.]MDO8901234.1 cation:proton antiporter [Phenylobacterium sp.]